MKEESEFSKRKSSKDGLRNTCRKCSVEYNREYRKKHRNEMLEKTQRYRETHKDYIKESRRKRHESNLAKLWELKTDCVKCGETRRCAIDFHHIDPSEKSFEVSLRKDRKYDEILSERKKCVCLCANCHREFHFLYGTSPNNPVTALTEYLGRNPYEV